MSGDPNLYLLWDEGIPQLDINVKPSSNMKSLGSVSKDKEYISTNPKALPRKIIVLKNRKKRKSPQYIFQCQGNFDIPNIKIKENKIIQILFKNVMFKPKWHIRKLNVSFY